MASTARLDELKKKFDENPRRYFAPLANEHRKSGDLDQAIALCRAHLPQQPAHISGHIVLAQALFEAGSLDEARENFHSALGLDPENLIALRYLGDIARDADDVETARSWYQRVLEVDPRNDEIVQIVRELDMPRAERTEVAEAEPPTSQPVAETTAPVAPPAAPAVATNDARFAPISLDSLELDESLDTAPASSSDDHATSQAPGRDSSDDSTWTAESPAMELPVLDTAGIDPFDMDPAASADALFDVHASSSSADDLLSELSASSHVSDSQFDVDEPSAVDPWTTAQPEAEVPTANVDAEVTASFEEGSFYAEEVPVSEARVEDTPVAEAQLGDETLDDVTLDDADFELPEAPQPEPVAAQVSEPMIEPMIEPIIESVEGPELVPEPVASEEAIPTFESSVPVEMLAEQPTEEWQAVQVPAEMAASSDDLGLEIMEFVPPSREPSAPVADVVADADPHVGHTPDLSSTPQGATPATFVTETMAELYLQQGFRNEALAVYRELLSRSPDDASLRERVAQIESGSMSSLGMANVSETVVESALRRQSARPAKSVRSFFASLAGRRAPVSPASLAGEDGHSEGHVEHVSAPSPDAERIAASETVDEAPAPEGDSSDSRVAPMMSAAETLASFDPFADAVDAAEPPPEAIVADASTDVFGMERFAATPNAELTTTETELVAPEVAAPELSSPDVVAPPPAEQAASSEPASSEPGRRTLEDLFPDTPVTAMSEAAAETLATAFGRTEPQGRPTRAANSELSLDKVFRGAPEGTPPADGGFSFDQFFSDSRPSSGGDVAAPALSPPDTGRSSGAAGDSHDIEQFTAWLEGLKKK